MLVLSLLMAACASPSTAPATTPPTPANTTTLVTPTPMPAGMTMSMPTTEGHMVHAAEHGGQLGMGETLHIEIVSEQPGQYAIYLSDPSGNPLPLEGVTLAVALIDPAGNELQVFTARLAGDGQYFVAEGQPAYVTQTDVRVTVVLPGNAEPVEMDFTLQYQP